MKRVLLVLVDGLRPDVAEAALARGELPALAALTAGGSVTRGVTVFPSTTGVAYLPFLTGCTPGRCNIPSIRWIEREQYTGGWWRERERVRSYCGYQAGRLDADITAGVRTIFELVPESLGIFTPIARGLAPERNPARTERQFWGALSHVAEWHQPGDNAVRRHLLRGIDRGWRFIFAQFPAVDGYTHQSTPDGPRVMRALRQVDATLAEVHARLQARGELDETLIVLVSDHGASSVHTHLDLADWFRGQQVRTMSHPVVWERDPMAAVMVAGNGSAMVYARPGVPRRARFTLAELRSSAGFGAATDLIATLVREPAVALVAAEEGPGAVRVADQAGEAIIHREADGRIRYQRTGGDPLAVGADLVLDQEEWLIRSWDGAYPDGCVQLLDQFAAARTGDLLVIGREGYDFRQRFEVPEHKAGHGSLIRAHMQIPIWSNAPIITDAPLRSVDLFPAMLHWLGVAVPAEIDGQLRWQPGGVAVAAR